MKGTKKLKQWLAHISFGIIGCDTYIIVEAETEEEASREAYEETIELASSYGFEQDLDFFGDNDSLGCNFDKETHQYEQEAFIDSSVCPYDPEKHDGYLK